MRACDAEGRSGIGAGMAGWVHIVEERRVVGYSTSLGGDHEHRASSIVARLSMLNEYIEQAQVFEACLHRDLRLEQHCHTSNTESGP